VAIELFLGARISVHWQTPTSTGSALYGQADAFHVSHQRPFSQRRTAQELAIPPGCRIAAARRKWENRVYKHLCRAA